MPVATAARHLLNVIFFLSLDELNRWFVIQNLFKTDSPLIHDKQSIFRQVSMC